MPGPAPKPADERARRNKTQVAMRLPAAGRAGDPPDWPVGYDPSTRADRVWAELWATPQAVAWERLGWTRVVARYVCLLESSERDLDDIDDPKVYAAMLSAQTKLLPELRQLEDRLGLNPLALLRLQWVVDSDEVGAKRDEHAEQSAAESRGARGRYSGLRSVGGGADAVAGA